MRLIPQKLLRNIETHLCIGNIFNGDRIPKKALLPRTFFTTAIISLILLASCRMTEMNKLSNSNAPANIAEKQDALSVHKRAIVVDMHTDTTQRLVDENVGLDSQLPDGHFDSVRAKQGGLDAQFFSIWVEPQLFGGGGNRAVERADIQIAAVKNLVEKHPETW